MNVGPLPCSLVHGSRSLPCPMKWNVVARLQPAVVCLFAASKPQMALYVCTLLKPASDLLRQLVKDPAQGTAAILQDAHCAMCTSNFHTIQPSTLCLLSLLVHATAAPGQCQHVCCRSDGVPWTPGGDCGLLLSPAHEGAGEEGCPRLPAGGHLSKGPEGTLHVSAP